jgi:hypothetical protein
MKRIVVICLFVVSFNCMSQNYELGKVTLEELREKTCPQDTSAVASILFSVGKVYFNFSQNNGFEQVFEKSVKIKIYKKEGYDYANQSIAYYVGGNNKEKVSVSKAITYNVEDNKIEKTKLTSDGEFTENVNKYYARKKITLPNVKVGSIIEFKFQVISSYLDISPWQFQSEIPELHSEFTTVIPEYYVYNTQNKGYLTPKIQQEKNTKTVTYTSKDRHDNGRLTSANFSDESISYTEQKTSYVVENAPALKEESFVNNLTNYTSGIEYELSSIQYPNQPFQNLATDWETVVKGIYQDDNFGSELNKSGYFEKDIEALLAGTTTPQEKIGVVFSYVKSKMNWNDYYGYNCDKGVKKAYQDKTGNIAEINLMLASMLRYAGFEANPILVSTRSNGISLFPSMKAFNSVIVGVELESQVVLLDATNKFTLPGILPIRDLNWFGRIIRKNGSSATIDLMPNSNSKEIITILASINEQGVVSGKIRDQYFDYNAFIYRNNYNGVTKDSYIEKLEKRHSGLEIGDYEVQNSNELSKPIVENYSFTSNNAVEIIGDKMYLSPLLFFATTENPFKQETREYPIDFVYPNQDKFNVSITIPEGYVVETLPQSKSVSMVENMAGFKYTITSNGNQIQLSYTADTNRAIIGSEYYEVLKNYYKEIILKQTEKIVLKKA